MRCILSTIMAILLLSVSHDSFAEFSPGILKGVVQSRSGKPLAGGMVYFFNKATGPAPVPEKYWRVPDEIAPLDSDGAFSAKLPPGDYYIGAIFRGADKRIIGPPSGGDMFFAGVKAYSITPAVLTDAGVIKEAVPFSASVVQHGENVTAIEGMVVDTDGKPVSGAVVFAYINAAMAEKPLYVSERTDSTGNFRLRVGGGGSYYLKVRDLYGGGTPSDGSLMGTYGGETPAAVNIKAGETVKKIKILGKRFVRGNLNPRNQKATIK